MRTIEVYTDGGCAPTNPGPGACAYVIVQDNVLLRSEIFRSPASTNNIMEMTAMVKALETCVKKYKDDIIFIFTDSQYLQQGITKWMPIWKKNNWRKSDKKEVFNKDLWMKIDELVPQLNVNIQWVRGHSGNVWNEYVDKLCQDK